MVPIFSLEWLLLILMKSQLKEVVMRNSIERTLTNPWILWSIFGAGFFLPYLFILFLPSIMILAWRHVQSEYMETTEFWIEKTKLKAPDHKKEYVEINHTTSPVPALSSM